jgi:hypothetical protein
MLRVEEIGYDVGGHLEVHRAIVGTRVEFFSLNFFKKPRVIGKHGRMVIREHWKSTPKIPFETTRAPKKTSWVLEILMF